MSLILDGTTGVALPTTGLVNRHWAQADLVSYVHADVNTAHRDIIKGAYPPAWFNQQWGGGVNYYELVDAATGTPYKFESATGYIEGNGAALNNSVVGQTYMAQGFKVAKSGNLSEIWVKANKTASPTANLQLFVYPDDGTGTKPTGSTPITNGTATAISGKLFQSGDTSGSFYRFVFPTPPAVTANTQYHYALKSSAAVSGTDYWVAQSMLNKKYPHGNFSYGDGTPTWTAFTTYCMNFLVVMDAATQTFQSGGIFGDGKAVFYEGSPLNQSNQRRADLADLKGLNMGSLTALFRGTAQTKDKTIADFTYGLDHDRVVIRCAVTTGFPVVTLYDSGGTARTVTGTTDISSGDHDVAVKVIANTGSSTDKLELWVDGASQGTAITGVAITFDELFRQGQIGSLWIGGGFALAPTWSGSSISSFTGLPSTLGWTYAGAATEANAFSVSGNKLYQNKSGYTALQDGYYKKTTAGFSNTNGLNVLIKSRIASNTNTKDVADACINVLDGTKNGVSQLQEYYMGSLSTTTQYPQADFKSADFVLNQIQKGSDLYVFKDGKLIADGTGLLTSATATNELQIGDISTVSGEQADVVHSYWKYYTTAALLPQATAGSLSEWAIWTGDKTSILATLWNSGSPISVKQFCGLGVNWKRGDDGAWVHRLQQAGITANSTTTAIATIAPEMEGFVIGDYVSTTGYVEAFNSAGGNGVTVGVRIDGALSADVGTGTYDTGTAEPSAGYNMAIPYFRNQKTYFGLHKITAMTGSGAGTCTLPATRRRITIEGRS